MPPPHPFRALTLLCAFLATGCGSASKAPPKRAPAPDPFAAETAYGQRCARLKAAHDAELRDKRYLPARLLLHRWPQAPGHGAGPATTPNVRPGGTPEMVDEARFIELLRGGRSRVALLIARGGTGKSKLAWSVEAQLCAARPIFRVDLQWDVAERLSEVPKGSNAVLYRLAATLGLDGRAAPEAALKAALKGKRALVLLDSLDEVALHARPGVVRSVNDALARMPELSALVLTRPPVYTGNYGLAHIDGMAELPMMDCGRTELVLARFIKDRAERTVFEAFVKRYGLDRKVKTAKGRCYYPHMATFRDFFVVKKLAGTHARHVPGAQMPPTFETSRVKLYEFYLRVSVVKDMQGIDVKAGDVLELVDQMLRAANPGAGQRSVGFDVSSCLSAVPRSMKENARKALCERLLQSSLFKPSERRGRWKLKNQSIYDFFLARWTHADMASRPRGAQCKAVAERADLFESNEVAGFLVGLPWGQRCLIDIAGELCRRGGYAQHNFEQLDQGLPAGKRRLKIIDDAQEGVEGVLEPHLCVGAVMDRLYKTAEQAMGAPDKPSESKGAR